jgi:hypothetical protein
MSRTQRAVQSEGGFPPKIVPGALTQQVSRSFWRWAGFACWGDGKKAGLLSRLHYYLDPDVLITSVREQLRDALARFL